MSEHKSVPEWAIKRACELANAHESSPWWYLDDYGNNGALTALAEHIAAHEEPPIHPMAEGLADAMNHSIDRLGIFEPDEAEDLIAELRRRGLEIVEASK